MVDSVSVYEPAGDCMYWKVLCTAVLMVSVWTKTLMASSQSQDTKRYVQFDIQTQRIIERWLTDHHLPIAYFTPHNVILLQSQKFSMPLIVMGLPNEFWAYYTRIVWNAKNDGMRNAMLIGMLAGLQLGRMCDDYTVGCDSGTSIFTAPYAHTYRLLGLCIGALVGAGFSCISHAWNILVRTKRDVIHANDEPYVGLHGLQKALVSSGAKLQYVKSTTFGAFTVRVVN